jgi:hypothetical protein
MLWQWYSEGFDVPGRCTLTGGTLTFNPDIDHEYLDRQRRRDPDNYGREFAAEFAERMESYFTTDMVEGALLLSGDVGAVEDVTYLMAIDQSGLSGRDRFGCAIAHCDEYGVVSCDVARSWDAKDIDSVMAEIAGLARAYRIGAVLRDQYAAGWVSSALAKVGLQSETRPPLPQVYSNLKSLLLGGNARLPDSAELKLGLLNTSAVYGRNNTMSIAHQRDSSGHADLADAVAGAVFAASGFSDPCSLVFSPEMVAAMPIDEEELLT